MGQTTSKSTLFHDYDAFVDKFKPRKTSDDCYTPAAVYDEVLAWCRETYAIPDDATILRPFRPGGDYEAEDYPPGCYVIDNPPFSILSQIVRHYVAHGIHFVLFAPGLTVLGAARHCNAVACCADIVYANGANVRTSFVTDLGPYKVCTAPELKRRIEKANKQTTITLPTYKRPEAVLTSADFGTLAHLGVDLRLTREACVQVGNIDAMRRVGKGLYGNGVLIGETLAHRVAAAKEAAKDMAQVAASKTTASKEVHVFALSAAEAEASRRLDAKPSAYVGVVGRED